MEEADEVTEVGVVTGAVVFNQQLRVTDNVDEKNMRDLQAQCFLVIGHGLSGSLLTAQPLLASTALPLNISLLSSSIGRWTFGVERWMFASKFFR
jgi:hypothetical protein